MADLSRSIGMRPSGRFTTCLHRIGNRPYVTLAGPQYPASALPAMTENGTALRHGENPCAVWQQPTPLEEPQVRRS
jgi:hypothetical protein